MLHKRPLTGRIVSLLIIGLYLAGLFYLFKTFLPDNLSLSTAFSGLGSFGSSRGNYSQKILTSSDGGKTWLTSTTLSKNYLSNFQCPTLETCFALTYSTESRNLEERQAIAVTNDSGKTWTNVSVPIYPSDNEENYNPFNLSCPNSTHCFVLTTSKDGDMLLETLNLGKSWQVVNANISDWNLNDLSCPGDKNCFAVGKDGRILYSADGGKNWTKQNSNVDRSLASIKCFSLTKCVAVGRAGTILLTEDAGNTWTKSKGYSSSENLYRLICPEAATCYVMSSGRSGGKLIVTNDGGQNWSNISLELDNIYNFSCPVASQCFATSGKGSLRVTNDGGKSWQELKKPDYQNIYNLSCPGKDRCLILAY